MSVSVPEILIEDIILNADNPFKKTRRWNHLRCKLCGEVVLRRGITRISDWEKVRWHLRCRHGIDPGPDVPIRLLSMPRFRQWVKTTDILENVHKEVEDR